MKTRTVEYSLDDRKVKLTFGEATSKMGMYRSVLVERALKDRAAQSLELEEPEEVSLDELAEQILQTVYYPSTIAGVIEQEGFESWPVSYEEFSKWPEPLAIEIEKILAELNPHWLSPEISAIVIDEEAKKK